MRWSSLLVESESFVRKIGEFLGEEKSSIFQDFMFRFGRGAVSRGRLCGNVPRGDVL